MNCSNDEKEVKGVRNWYNSIASAFQCRYQGAEGQYWLSFESLIYKKMVNFKDKRVLDLGTGGGRYTFEIASAATEVIGVDISEEMINLANKRKKAENVLNVQFETGDARKLRFPPCYFDIVISSGMLEYLKSPRPFVEEISRIIKDEGIFLFSCHRKRISFLLFRIYNFIMDYFLSRVYLPNAVTYSEKLVSRASFWEKAYHNFSTLKVLLKDCGFKHIEYRTTCFRVPTLLFYWGNRRKIQIVQKLAIQMNLFLGWLFLTKWTGSIIIIKASK